MEELDHEFVTIEGRMEHAGDLLYHVLDRCVDEYTAMTNEVEKDIDRIERAIVPNPQEKVAKDIFSHKRHLQ